MVEKAGIISSPLCSPFNHCLGLSPQQWGKMLQNGSLTKVAMGMESNPILMCLRLFWETSVEKTWSKLIKKTSGQYTLKWLSSIKWSKMLPSLFIITCKVLLRPAGNTQDPTWKKYNIHIPQSRWKKQKPLRTFKFKWRKEPLSFPSRLDPLIVPGLRQCKKPTCEWLIKWLVPVLGCRDFQHVYRMAGEWQRQIQKSIYATNTY